MALDCRRGVTEIEKFIMANTQELAKDKWLCPLSGKKFKGPEFVRKHILTKHVEKLDEMKKEASTRGVQKVHRLTQLTHHILSLFDIFPCN